MPYSAYSKSTFMKIESRCMSVKGSEESYDKKEFCLAKQ